MIQFTCYVKAEPQGSSKAFVIGGKARITSANTKLKPFRSEVTRCAIQEMLRLSRSSLAWDCAPMFSKHVPVRLTLEYTFRKPASVSKKRTHHVVKPDLDKIVRATGDALTGVIYHDDAQVCEMLVRKHYGAVECVTVTAEEMHA